MGPLPDRRSWQELLRSALIDPPPCCRCCGQELLPETLCSATAAGADRGVSGAGTETDDGADTETDDGVDTETDDGADTETGDGANTETASGGSHVVSADVKSPQSVSIEVAETTFIGSGVVVGCGGGVGERDRSRQLHLKGGAACRG